MLFPTHFFWCHSGWHNHPPFLLLLSLSSERDREFGRAIGERKGRRREILFS